jgi:Protein of unknown function (DUF3662)/FHA domain
MVLSRLERRLERLVEGTFSKAFRSGLQPVEIGRRLIREVEVGRTLGLKGPVAPNYFVVRLSLDDAERFAGFREAFVTELAQSVREHARAERYSFVGPVVVEIDDDERLRLGNFTVTARIDANVEGAGAAVALPDGAHVRLGTEAANVIGRLPECAVRLSDPEVSRHHAAIELTPSGWIARDLGSTNGTIVNGVTASEHRLNDGDQIRVGATTLVFRVS